VVIDMATSKSSTLEKLRVYPSHMLVFTSMKRHEMRAQWIVFQLSAETPRACNPKTMKVARLDLSEFQEQ
jgi:hypothetical protein